VESRQLQLQLQLGQNCQIVVSRRAGTGQPGLGSVGLGLGKLIQGQLWANQDRTLDKRGGTGRITHAYMYIITMQLEIYTAIKLAG
jgi:hypothetical protein